MAVKARRVSSHPKSTNGRVSTGNLTKPTESSLASAAAAHQAGRVDEAKVIYQEILDVDPNNADALQLMGVAFHQQGDQETALRFLEQAVSLSPANPYVRNNYGGVLKMTGRFEAADYQFSEALRLLPDYSDALVNKGATLAELDHFHDAEVVLRRAIEIDPANPEARRRLGHVYVKMEKFADAEKELRAFLAKHPDNAEELSNLAYSVQQQGRIEEGGDLFRQAQAHAGDNPVLLQHLRDLLGAGIRNDEERAEFRDALRRSPALWPTEVGIAATLIGRGKVAEAQQIIEDILAAHADNVCVWSDMGATLITLGKYQQAAQILQKAIEIDPKFANAHNNLGNVYLTLGHLPQAIKEFRQALSCNPGLVQAQVIMTRALRLAGDFDQAHLFGRAALEMPRIGVEEMPILVQLFKSVCDFEGIERLGDIWENCDKLKLDYLIGTFLDLLVFTRGPDEIARLKGLVRKWATKMEGMAIQSPLTEPRPPSVDGRIRVGLLSADLRSHSVSRFLLPLVQGYDRSKIALHCYSPYRYVNDPMQELIQGSVDKFTFVDNMTVREIAQEIRGDGIDVLLELNGFTQGSRLGALAYKPAPVQMSWLGYPFTCGLQAIDYVLMDRFVLPTDEGTLVEEALVMPDAWICFGKFPEIEVASELPMERNGYVTFGTLNNPYKFDREIIALWARVMAQVPNSRFLLVRPEASSVVLCRHLAAEFGKHGIGADRLFLFNNRTENRNHLTYYNDIDISLDTFPVTGGTTTCEALWMGVPVVSMVGAAYHQRISYAILRHCGLQELCADTSEEFVARAVALAGDRAKLSAWRCGLREVMQKSPLCDEPRFLHQFQDMLEQVVQLHGLR